MAKPPIARLHFITPDRPGADLARMVEQACLGGVRAVQLRVKGRTWSEWCLLAREVQDVCRRFDATLIVNDSPEVAKAIDADGVHVGDMDCTPFQARAILGPSKIVGATANTPEEALGHCQAGVDYIGLGPYRFTTTKEKLKPELGLSGMSRTLNALTAAGYRTPVIAVGGIVEEDCFTLRDEGIFGIAVCNAIAASHEVRAAAKRFVSLW